MKVMFSCSMKDEWMNEWMIEWMNGMNGTNEPTNQPTNELACLTELVQTQPNIQFFQQSSTPFFAATFHYIL